MKPMFTLMLVFMLTGTHAAFAQHMMAHAMKGHKMSHAKMYADMKEHEMYTPAQARKMHYRSDTGNPLVPMPRGMMKSMHATDDKM